MDPQAGADRELQRVRQAVDLLRMCEVCSQPHLFPMSQCQNGHLYCRACFARTGQCPTCRTEVLSPARCLLADLVAEALDIPMRCRWGCGHSAAAQPREAHEAVCGHRPVQCAGCDLSLPAAELLLHCAREHGVPHSAGSHRVEPPALAGAMKSVVLLPTAAGPAPPAVVVHLQRADDGSRAIWIWAQAAGHEAAGRWEVVARADGPELSATLTFPLAPLVRSGAVVPAGSARRKAPRLDLSGFPEEAWVQVALRPVGAADQDSSSREAAPGHGCGGGTAQARV